MQNSRLDLTFPHGFRTDPEYPDIKKGYYLAMRLGLIYHQCKFKDIALTRLARWYDEVDKSGFLTFGRVAHSIQTHYLNISTSLKEGQQMQRQNLLMQRSKLSEHSLGESEIKRSFYTDLLNYMHKMKIPQSFTLILFSYNDFVDVGKVGGFKQKKKAK